VCHHSSHIALCRYCVPSTTPAHFAASRHGPWRSKLARTTAPPAPCRRCRPPRTWRLGVAAVAIVAQVRQHARQAGPAKDEAACSGQDGQ
jgi:hypothetical protein